MYRQYISIGKTRDGKYQVALVTDKAYLEEGAVRGDTFEEAIRGFAKFHKRNPKIRNLKIDNTL